MAGDGNFSNPLPSGRPNDGVNGNRQRGRQRRMVAAANARQASPPVTAAGKGSALASGDGQMSAAARAAQVDEARALNEAVSAARAQDAQFEKWSRGMTCGLTYAQCELLSMVLGILVLLYTLIAVGLNGGLPFQSVDGRDGTVPPIPVRVVGLRWELTATRQIWQSQHFENTFTPPPPDALNVQQHAPASAATDNAAAAATAATTAGAKPAPPTFTYDRYMYVDAPARVSLPTASRHDRQRLPAGADTERWSGVDRTNRLLTSQLRGMLSAGERLANIKFTSLVRLKPIGPLPAIAGTTPPADAPTVELAIGYYAYDVLYPALIAGDDESEGDAASKYEFTLRNGLLDIGDAARATIDGRRHSGDDELYLTSTIDGPPPPSQPGTDVSRAMSHSRAASQEKSNPMPNISGFGSNGGSGSNSAAAAQPVASSTAATAAASASAAAASSGTAGVMNKLTAEEEKEFREIFNLVDKDKGGSISKKELSQLMTTLGINADENEINLMINEIDKNNNNEIEFEEFVAVMSRKVQATYTADEVKAAFKVFEAGAQPGFVNLSTLESALTRYGSHSLTPSQVKELIAQLDPGDGGMFNYHDVSTSSPHRSTPAQRRAATTSEDDTISPLLMMPCAVETPHLASVNGQIKLNSDSLNRRSRAFASRPVSLSYVYCW